MRDYCSEVQSRLRQVLDCIGRALDGVASFNGRAGSLDYVRRQVGRATGACLHAESLVKQWLEAAILEDKFAARRADQAEESA